MIRPALQLVVCSALLSTSLILSGCGQSALANRKYYLLDVTRSVPAAAVHADATLQVRRLDVDQAFASKLLVYRISATRYEPDFYDEFLIPPGVMITQEIRDWLAGSGLFQRVIRTGSPVEPTYVLDGTVLALYGDFTKGTAPEAVMEIRFYLLATGSSAKEGVVLAKTYQAKAALQEKTAEAIVAAWSEDLADILTRLEADLGKAITEESKK